MKPAKPEPFKKIKKEDLRETPEWIVQTIEDAKQSPLASMSEKEIGRLCEELAERAAKKRQAQAT